MSFNSALSGANLISLRGDASTANTYQNQLYISINANTNIYTAQVNQTTFVKPAVELEYDGGAGTLANVNAGMTVLISHTNDRTAAHFRGRVRKVPGATTLYINETGADFQENDFIFVLDDYDTHIKLPIYQNGIKIDWEETYSGLPPLISNLQSVYPAFVDSGTSVITLVLAPTVTAAESGASISTYLWDEADGTITVGTSASQNVTITFPAGERWISLTATDDGGLATTRYIKVHAHDTGGDAPTLIDISDVSYACEIPIQINEGASEGWSASISAFAGVSAILDRTLVTLWNVEKYNGSETNIVNNIAMVGRLRNEDNVTEFLEDGQIDANVDFTIEGPLAQLADIDAPSFEAANSSSATSLVINVTDLNIWRMIWLILSQFSTFGSVHSISFDSVDDTFLVAGLITQGSDLLFSVGDLAQSINAVFQGAQWGECEVVRRATMLPTADRSGLVAVADLTNADIVESLGMSRDYIKSIGIVDSSGGGYNESSGNTTAYLAVAPPGAPDEPPDEGQLPRQILAANLSVSAEQAELIERAGNALAAMQAPDTLSAVLNDGWGFATPSVNQRWTWTLAAGLTARGIVYDNTVDWWLQSLSVSPNIESGIRETVATFIKETDGFDGEIIPPPVIDAGAFGTFSDFGELEEFAPVSSVTTTDDFTIDEQGWEAGPAGVGTYSGPNGWIPDCVGGAEEFLDIIQDFSTTETVTSVTITYDATYAGGATLGNFIYLRTQGGQYTEIDNWTTASGAGQTRTATISPLAVTGLRVRMFAGGSDCTGSLLITSITYDTLQDLNWAHVFDLTLTNGGFSAFDSGDGNGNRAVYNAGVGWESSNDVDIDHIVQIEQSFSSTFITQVTINVSVAAGDFLQISAPDVGGAEFFDSNAGGLTFTANPNTLLTGLWFSADNPVGSGKYTGAINSITVKGTGIDPF